MISAFFNALFFEPFYNAFIFLIDSVPYHDVGIAIVVLTLIVKFALFSITFKSIKAQATMRALQPEIDALRERYKDDKQQQALKTLELYRREGVNPFSSILTILIQIPVLLGLYFVFLRGGLPTLRPELFYSFITAPESINMVFLGAIDLAERSLPLALLAGISQYFQSLLIAPKVKKEKENPSLKNDLAHSMSLQMRYVLPVIIGFIAYRFSAGLALYWSISNMFTIAQELYVRRTMTPINTGTGAQSAGGAVKST